MKNVYFSMFSGMKIWKNNDVRRILQNVREKLAEIEPIMGQKSENRTEIETFFYTRNSV